MLALTFPLNVQYNVGQPLMSVIGSSNGRGPRCSGWFADYIADKGDAEMQALTLAGGIKGWVKAGEEYTKNVEGYDAGYWKQFN
jgi:arsenical-resistance protein 2